MAVCVQRLGRMRREPDKGLDSRRFEARVAVGAIDATTVGPALNEAANKVAADVADWVK